MSDPAAPPLSVSRDSAPSKRQLLGARWKALAIALVLPLYLLVGPGVSVLAATAAADPAPTLEQRVEALESSRNLLYFVAGGTAIAVVLGWFHLVRRADCLARKHVDRIVERYPGAVERLVQEHETEARLRREARVAVVSEGLELQGLLREHGFRNLTTVSPTDLSREQLDPCAAVVLDLTGGWSQEAAGALIQSDPRDVFLAYSTAAGRLSLPAGRATFANSPITLYARLMELLKFHEARQKEG